LRRRDDVADALGTSKTAIADLASQASLGMQP
jgi:hypothetical protein